MPRIGIGFARFVRKTDMVPLFVCTLFLSSTLLFLVQPMIAKMVLPLLGGTPAVWNTCMVFFQGTLLAGYLYVHALTQWLRLKHQTIVHVCLLVASLLTLPIALATSDGPPADGMPILWLTRVLILSVGVPFFVVSTTGPLLQRLFARTAHASAGDPYFLSVAGNLGSIAALLAYPSGLEPTLRLAEQSRLWAGCYAAFVFLMVTSIVLAYRAAARTSSSDRQTAFHPVVRIPWRNKLRFVALASIPSSLMLGLTTFLTTDVAPVPLFWVLPLTLYLASFALVFAKRTLVPHALMLRLLPMLAIVLVTVMVFGATLSPPVQAPLHLLMFFVAAMVCHGELARSRPSGAQLTEFYLLMSIGGVLGGLFNALFAPLAFRTVVEYPLAIVLACAVSPSAASRRQEASSQPVATTAVRVKSRILDFALPVVFGAVMLITLTTFSNRSLLDPVAFIPTLLVPAVVCFSLRARPLRFALSLAAVMMASSAYLGAHQPVSYRGRSYYSVFKVVTDPARRLRLLIHARTIHGAQSMDPDHAGEPLTYYHRTGPIGQAFATFTNQFAKRQVGVIGLGAGSLAAYANAGDRWTFYEIDPTIEAMARDPRYFTFLRDSRGDVRVIVGDARLSLTREPDQTFDLLVVDAFGSDAIPLHLLTREALKVYVRTLRARGVLAFHLSNRYMDLQPLVGDLAHDAGLVALAQNDKNLSAEEAAQGKAPSTWVLVARAPDDFGPLNDDRRWQLIPPRFNPIVWTDDFSNPLGIVRWR